MHIHNMYVLIYVMHNFIKMLAMNSDLHAGVTLNERRCKICGSTSLLWLPEAISNKNKVS